MFSRITVVLISSVWLIAVSAITADDGPLFRIEEKGKWGFINAEGSVVITPQYDDCYYQFSEGLAAVKVGDKWGYIDRENRMVIPPRFDSAERFQNGIAAVGLGEPFKGSRRYGYIDRSGKYVISPSESISYSGFHDGRMCVKVDDKWGYIDVTGKQVIPAVYDSADDFSDGLAAVRQGDRHGFINTAGEWVIRLNGSVPVMCSRFKEGLASVLDSRSGKCGYIDKSGDFAIAPRFSNAKCFSEGRAAICMEELDETGWPVRKWGFIDKSGKIVIPPKYKFAWEFREGMSKVGLNKKVGFVDINGVEVVPCRFWGVDPFENGLALVTVGGYSPETGWSGYIDKTGRFVWRPSDFAERDKARLAEENPVPTIRVFSDPKSEEKGLLVTCEKKVPTSGKIVITVVNRLDEEVFLEVTDFDSLGYDLEDRDGGVAGGGGVGFFFPDNTRLLKRLHASRYTNGKRFTCGCAVAYIKGKLDSEALEMAPARGTVHVSLSGFYRNTGKSFSESIELPIEILGGKKEIGEFRVRNTAKEALLPEQASETKKETAAKEKNKEQYIPKDIDDCFAELRKILPPKTIEEMKNGSEEDMISYHHGLGTWIRNNWGLWKGSRLSKWFNDKGIKHPDDMSGIIFDSFWRQLNGKPIKFDEQIKHYQDYWKKVKEREQQGGD